jgi:hypothetical protein
MINLYLQGGRYGDGGSTNLKIIGLKYTRLDGVTSRSTEIFVIIARSQRLTRYDIRASC